MDFLEFRKELKRLAQLQFDGDYNVLYSQIKNKIIDNTNGITVEQFLQSRNTDISEFSTMYGNFQISVPVLCDEWNTSSYKPNVAYNPYGIKEGELTSIHSINSVSKNLQMLRAIIEPSQTVVVLGLSERTNILGEISTEFENNPYKYSNGQLKVCDLRIPNIGAIEGWLKGGPELRLRVYGYVSSNSSQTSISPNTLFQGTFDPSRNSVKNGQWVDPLFNMFFWNTTPTLNNLVYGTRLRFVWIEMDGNGQEQTVSIPLNSSISVIAPNGLQVTATNSTTLTWKRDKNDIQCGNVDVNKTDPSGSMYGTGLLQWKVKN